MMDSSVLFALDEEEPELLEAVLKASEAFELIVTHVQLDEDERGSEAIAALPLVVVPTSHFVLGESRLGMAELGEAETFEPLREGSSKHTRDALIAATAERHGATLVMRDRSAEARIRRAGIRLNVWTLEDLRDAVGATAENRGTAL